MEEEEDFGCFWCNADKKQACRCDDDYDKQQEMIMDWENGVD